VSAGGSGAKPPNENAYRGALDKAIAEYERLGEERRRIDDRLAQLTQTITTLSRLVGLEPTIPFGLTDACRLVYRNAGIPLSPTEVRERLRAIGFDLSNYSNEMAAIHTVVRRLNVAGELRAMAVPGKQIYAWRTPTAAYAISPELAEHIRESGTFHVPSPPARARRRKK
jgi:hypothetical protein